MSPLEIVAILALSAWAIYKQTVVAEVDLTNQRFKMAIIYAVVGVAVGGFDTPSGWAGWAMIALGLALSFVVGLVRGRCTRLWVADGKIWRQGTALTVGLFLGLIVVKFGLGTLAYFWHVDDGAGFGEVLVMIAIMIVAQVQIIQGRALALRNRSGLVERQDAAATTGR
ncbi:MAG TPA: hypothetical protein VFU98_05260 [Microlunatus sp.]|nr:hypothetical protein [Microlunatus sp.]